MLVEVFVTGKCGKTACFFVSLHYKKRTEIMSESSNQKALIEQLLSDRDAEFRRATKAKQQLKELSDVKRMKADYEAKLAEKDKAIQECDQTIESKENRIAQLEQKLLYLERKMWVPCLKTTYP